MSIEFNKETGQVLIENGIKGRGDSSIFVDLNEITCFSYGVNFETDLYLYLCFTTNQSERRISLPHTGEFLSKVQEITKFLYERKKR